MVDAGVTYFDLSAIYLTYALLPDSTISPDTADDIGTHSNEPPSNFILTPGPCLSSDDAGNDDTALVTSPRFWQAQFPRP